MTMADTDNNTFICSVDLICIDLQDTVCYGRYKLSPAIDLLNKINWCDANWVWDINCAVVM